MRCLLSSLLSLLLIGIALAAEQFLLVPWRIVRSIARSIARLARRRPTVSLVPTPVPEPAPVDDVFPETVVISHTPLPDDEVAPLRLSYELPPLKLLESLKEAVNGGVPMSPEVARRVISLFREIRPPERADYNLTPHEIRLLKLFVKGHNYKTAAKELNVTVHTISFHLRSIYEKLQVHSKSAAVAKALENRLI